jgi:signal transduction histidine kinase
MKPQFELLDDAFHVLSQPVTALRTALELGLRDEADQPAARKIFEDCLGQLDRLMQELAIFREIASLEEEAPIACHDARQLLEACVEEMAAIAEAGGVALDVSAEQAAMQCNAPMLERAIFLLLDEMIAGTGAGGDISIRLTAGEQGLQLELRPGTSPGRHQQLYRKLIQVAGGSEIHFDSERTRCTFPRADHRH